MIYTNSVVSIPVRNGADKLVYKSAGSSAVMIAAGDRVFRFTAPAVAGRYACL